MAAASVPDADLPFGLTSAGLTLACLRPALAEVASAVLRLAAHAMYCCLVGEGTAAAAQLLWGLRSGHWQSRLAFHLLPAHLQFINTGLF